MQGVQGVNLDSVIMNVAQMAINYIFVTAISNQNQKQTVLDLKTDLRMMKDDLMNEQKENFVDTMNQIKESAKNGQKGN